MGAPWRPGTAALLLALAAALAVLPPAAVAGSEAAPELTDPAGDQEVEAGPLVVPGVNDEAFDDVDLVAAWVEERGNACVGQTADTCPAATLVVQTTAGWTTGTMTVTFTVKQGPASLPASTATNGGTPFTLTVTGATVAGLDNATAANGADGLRITLPLSKLGAGGGDLLADLAITTTRTDPGAVQGADQDDQTGTDSAGPGTAYTFSRPAVSPQLLLDVVSVDGKTGAVTITDPHAPVPVVLRVTNLALDDDGWQLSFSSTPPLADPPVFAQAFTPIAAGDSAETTVELSLEGTPEGPVSLSFTAMSERGASTTARTTLTLDIPSAGVAPGEREVKPEGLGFLSPAAEGAGFDGPFGSFAEMALLALLVLLTILAIFLLMALGRTTIDEAPASPAPRPAGAAARGAARVGPAGLSETVRAGEAPPLEAPPALFAAAEPTESEAAVDAMPDVDPAALAAALAPQEEADDGEPMEFEPAPAPTALPTAAAGARIRIEEVRHTPREPDAGQGVRTEVLLRNDGPTATLRVALSVDGRPAAERTVQVPAHATKAVELPWTAGPGDNRVKISAYPA